ncbi:cyclic nucleotide-binding domain-containing protein [Candidatus Dependentiae bacterium]|nr:cyclic nucleotide-binding domain-containing protein [Candidatus Dependentiae bacterium]
MEKINFSKDDVICYQGDASDGLYILIDGELEVLIAEEINAEMKKSEILAQSKRVGLITEKKTTFGEISFILNAPRNATIRAVSNGAVVKIPTGADPLKTLLRSNPVIGLSISKTLLQKSLSTYGVIENTIKLLQQAQMYYDNLAYMYYKINMNAQNKDNPVYKDGKILHSKAHSNGNKISDKLSIAIIETNLSQVWEHDYGINIDLPNINLEIIDIVKSILYLPEKVAKIAIKLSPNIVEFSCLKLSEYLQELNGFFVNANNLAEQAILKLAGQSESIFESYFSLYSLLKSANHPNIKFVEKALGKLIKLTKELHNQYSEMYNAKIKDLSKEYLKQESKIKDEEKTVEIKKEEAKKAVVIQQSDLIIDDNFNKLMTLQCSNEDTKSKLRTALEKYHKLIDKFDTAGDARKIKKELEAAYWDFYKDAFLHYMEKGGNLPNYTFLMLRYGILDENLLNEETINCIKSTPFQTKHTFPIFYADEWLAKIHDNEEKPSINGLGQTYDEYVKENKVNISDPASALLNFEIKEVVAAQVRTAAGLIAQQSPIVDSDYINLKPENCIVTKERLENTLKEILDIDFSLFYREVRLVYGDQADFVQKEVIPNFIIVPVSGSKAICWQEIDNRNKASRARIVVPLFATADLKEMLLLALAHFRWELAKTIVGPNWGDPIEGGMTGKYFDYTSTYKQSKELNAETKEKIKKQFKKLPQTKDRYAEDYLDWIINESQAVFKLNVLTRDIFFQYVPFNKRIRDKQSANPNFAKLNFKFVNLNKKKLVAIDNKIKKLEKMEIQIPQDVKNEFEYYKLLI